MRNRTLGAVQSPFFWLGLSLLAALGFALVSSDGLAWLARESAAYQRQIQHQLSTSLQDVGSGTGSAAALWILLSLCFSYGVVHTLGPGHGKAVIVAYFLDGTEPRRWIEGLFAGAWIAITHTLSALILATSLKLNLTRNKLAEFLPDHEAIRQFERLFAVADAVPDLVDQVDALAGDADAKATLALSEIAALSQEAMTAAATAENKAAQAMAALDALRGDVDGLQMLPPPRLWVFRHLAQKCQHLS
jgi:hypothetical protein